MAFHFSLDGVLRFRCSLERREHLKLQALLSKRSDLLREIERLRSTRLRLLTEMREALRSEPLSGAELELVAAKAEGLARDADGLQLQLQELKPEILLQTARYRSERQQREVLESLRDRQLQEYQRVQQRREQAALDELHLIRRNLSRQHLPN